MSNKDKDLISVIEGMFNETLTEAEHNAHNKKAHEVITSKPKPHADSPDTQGVVGGKDVGVLDAGGAEDVGSSKGDHASDAADNSKEVGIGAADGKTLDAGGDKDVAPSGEKGKFASDASGKVEADQSGEAKPAACCEEEEVEESQDLKNDKDADGKDDKFKEKDASDVKEKCDDEDEVKEAKYKELKIEKDCDEDVEEACGSMKEKLHGDQHKLDHNNNGKVDGDDLAKVRKHGVKEDEDLDEAEGETLKKVSGEANREQRPDAEKGDNAPETKKDTFGAEHKPHSQAGDEFETSMKAKGKTLAAESEDLDEAEYEEFVMGLSEDDFEALESYVDEQISEDEELDEEKLSPEQQRAKQEKQLRDFRAKGGKVKQGKPGKEPKKHSARGANAPQRGQPRSDVLNTPANISSRNGSSSMRKEEVEENVLEQDFKEKAAIIFETTVNEKVLSIQEQMEQDFAEKLQEEKEALNAKVEELVAEATQEWIAENQLEIKYSLRTEISENFIRGLKGLFAENYIEIPDDEVSVVDELTEAVESFKDIVAEQEVQLEEANAIILESKKNDVFDNISEGLTETQKIKLEKLAKAVVAEDIEEFGYKVEQLKESYFTETAERMIPLADEIIQESAEPIVESGSPVNVYANFLSKTVR